MSGIEIRIEGQPVFLFGDTGYDHLYLVLVNESGAEFVLRGYPSGAFGTGDIIFEHSVPMEESADSRPLEDHDLVGSRVLDLGDRLVDDVWHIMGQQAWLLEDAKLDYSPFLHNSNSAVASLLHVVGIDVASTLPDQLDRTDAYVGVASILDSIGFHLNGTAQDDILVGGRQIDDLFGEAGDDILTGQAGRDRLAGGSGADFINGGWGPDTLIGDGGADRFYHAIVAGHGSDWITDFSNAEGDHLVFSGGAEVDDFQVNYAASADKGQADVDEAFIIWRPTGQIVFALIDGAELDAIWLNLDSGTLDLLA